MIVWRRNKSYESNQALNRGQTEEGHAHTHTA